jgi:glycosyltransferase involved in cell wall biosynthesis
MTRANSGEFAVETKVGQRGQPGQVGPVLGIDGAVFNVGSAKAGDVDPMARSLELVRAELASKSPADALAAWQTAMVADIQHDNQRYLAEGSTIRKAARVYEEIAIAAGLGTRVMRLDPAAGVTRPVRLLIVTFGIGSGQAASEVITKFIEGLDKKRWTCGVLSCEELSERSPALKYGKRPLTNSVAVAGPMLERLRSMGPLAICPLTGNLLDSAMWGVTTSEKFKPDVAMFVASPACPVQAMMLHRRVAPVQVNMSIGLPLPVAGVDMIISNNPQTYQRDRGTYEQDGFVTRCVETSGGDAQRGKDASKQDRLALAIPLEAKVLISVSNKLEHRMLAGNFAEKLLAFLQRRKDVCWIGVGRGEFSRIRELAVSRGVASRMLVVQNQTDPTPWVKMADVFLNEYPEGGGNSVIEAMGTGVPVVALHAGVRHAECIGAILVGDQDSIRGNDTEKYWARVEAWVDDPQARADAGKRQQERALACLDYAAVGKQYQGHLLEALKRGGLAGPAIGE